MFDSQDDPLGLGLKQRARARRQSLEALNPQAAGYMSGPLPDENWDAFFQAVDEAAGDKPVGFAGGTAPGSNQLVGIAPNALVGEGTHGENLLEQANPFTRLAMASGRQRRLRQMNKKVGL
jgi:hypothetical protein